MWPDSGKTPETPRPSSGPVRGPACEQHGKPRVGLRAAPFRRRHFKRTDVRAKAFTSQSVLVNGTFWKANDSALLLKHLKDKM